MSDHKFSFEGIGTKWIIDLYQVDQIDLEDLEKKVRQRVEEFDQNYSRFRTDSLVWQMSQKTGWFDLPSDASKMLDSYEKLYEITEGKFTPLIGDLIAAAGYDRLYSFKSEVSEPVKQWNEALERKSNQIQIKSPVMLDFGAAGKGYLVDIITDLIEKNGVKKFCVDGSGDIYAFGQTQKVGLENPFDITQVVGVVDLENESICGSATNRRKWGNYHHIFDPKTGRSTVGIVATWVIAPNAMLADALSTCLFLVPIERLVREFDFEFLILDSQMNATASKGFRDGLFSGTK